MDTDSEFQGFPDWCDTVVMLTWSDWHLEPRSNRYHYATRLARHRPVFFFQPDSYIRDLAVEKVAGHDIEVVHVPWQDDDARAKAMLAFLRTRGARRPLLWIYNPNFERFVALANAPMRIFHATEDYLSEDAPFTKAVGAGEVVEAVRRCVNQCDFVVAVSQGVADNIRDKGRFQGPLLVLRNGCDFQFWSDSAAAHYEPGPAGSRVVFYQGNLNVRVDYVLLADLADRMPDWTFQFCGSIAHAPEGWQALLARSNVRYLGMLDPAGIANAARHARVGLIPFVEADYIWRSLPLKAYEYLACGLPVVTVPIEELQSLPDLFATARGPEEFEAAILRLADTRIDESRIALRLQAARAVSYDSYFERLIARLHAAMSAMIKRRPRLNVLMFYDERSVHVKTIREHLDAFSLYSHCRFHFMSGTGPCEPDVEPVDLRVFDAVAIHYSIRLSLTQHLSQDIAASISIYDGPKLLFIQDEYDTTETARRWIERLALDCVFTNVPLNSLEHIYPAARFGHVDFLPTLTGYVPEDERIDEFVTPLKERRVLIGYRGRKLPHQYGALGWDKFRIGLEMKRIVEDRGLEADIEVDDARRIYGDDWYRFLGSCRSTLGTESGCNLFDDDGAYATLASQNADLSYPEFAARYLPDGEGAVRMNQISPKIFEAIRLRTVLILLEGSYSGIVKPDVHFIPLKHDLSNVDDVLAKLQDLDFVTAMTDRAYRDIIGSGLYSLRAFVDGVDAYLHLRARGRKRATFVTVPLFAAAGSQLVAAQRKGSLRPIVDQLVPPGVLTQAQIYDQLRIIGAELYPPIIPLMAQVESALAGSTAAIAQYQNVVGLAEGVLVTAQAAIIESQAARHAVDSLAQDVRGILATVQQTGVAIAHSQNAMGVAERVLVSAQAAIIESQAASHAVDGLAQDVHGALASGQQAGETVQQTGTAVQPLGGDRHRRFWYRGAQAVWHVIPAPLRFRFMDRVRRLRGR